MAFHQSKFLIAITGPTATGKTSLSIQLAEKLKSVEIISVDSRQLYRYMNIGTAKPTLVEQQSIKHHFIDIKDPNESYSAGDFGREVRIRLDEMWTRGITPLLVGGSGLYLQAVLDGLFEDTPASSSNRAHLLRRLAVEGLSAMYEELGHLDPLIQTRIVPKDARRIIRALEIAHSRKLEIGQSITPPHSAPIDCQSFLFFMDRDRHILYQRIAKRVDYMLSQGLVTEVDELRRKGYGQECPAMSTLGYAEIFDFLENRCSLSEAAALIKKRSQKYAKRQLTWFRGDRRLRWLNLDRWGNSGIIDRILAHLDREDAL